WAGGGDGVLGSVTRTGGRHVPASTAPAASAIATGLASTRPWPIASAASSVASLVVGIWPVKAGRGSFHPVPMPRERPAVCSWSALRRDASPMKAVLHDRAKSTEKGTVPEVSPSKLVKIFPPTVTLGGQATGLSGVTPVGIR